MAQALEFEDMIVTVNVLNILYCIIKIEIFDKLFRNVQLFSMLPVTDGNMSCFLLLCFEFNNACKAINHLVIK